MILMFAKVEKPWLYSMGSALFHSEQQFPPFLFNLSSKSSLLSVLKEDLDQITLILEVGLFFFFFLLSVF